jgi:hypothetical protein
VKKALLTTMLAAALGGAAGAAPEAVDPNGKVSWQHVALGALVGVSALFAEKPKPSAKPSRKVE